MKVLCAFGKNQYGDPKRGVGTEYAAFIPALKNIGCTVVHFELWDRSQFQNFAELNRSLLRMIKREKPDLLLTVPLHYEIWLETLDIIRKESRVATVCWTTDDSWKYDQFSRFVGNAFDTITTTYPSILPKYKADGIPNVLLTQWAANSGALRPPIHGKDCKYKISFIGASHGNRKKRIEELQARGFEVSCFGNGWPRGSISASRIPEIMRNSAISLNFSNSSGENQIKARTFEVPGAGGFLLTETASGLENFYKLGKEIVAFDDIDDLTKKLEFYLKDHDARDQIAMAGFKRTRKEHTYEIRMEQILKFTKSHRGKNRKPDPSFSPASLQKADDQYRVSFFLSLLRSLLLFPCILIWGKQRGPRAARRMLFEFSWRLVGAKTYRASGWPGRLFYKES